MTESLQPLIRLIDDDPAVLQAMSFLFTVEGLANRTFLSAETFLREDSPSCPGVAVVDLKMPSMNGMELLAELKTREFSHPIIILTAHGDIDLAVLAMKAGAFDFLQKPLNPEKFLATIHRALDTDRINNGFNLKEAQGRYRELSPREREIIQRVSIGMSNKAVAEDLVLSKRTVESHRASAYRKLKVKNVGDLQQLLSALETEEREQERSLKEMRQTKFR